jgi:hypothetical protein
MPEYESSESDVDESISSATQNLDNNTVTQDQADKQKASDDDSSSDDDNDITTRTSSRQKLTPVTFKARLENPNAQKKENLLKQYNSNKAYANDRNSILATAITKHFPGHGSFNGKITEYHPASDNYSITYEDGDSEIMSHSNILKYIKGTQQYEDHHEKKTKRHSVAPLTQQYQQL